MWVVFDKKIEIDLNKMSYSEVSLPFEQATATAIQVFPNTQPAHPPHSEREAFSHG